MVNRQWVQVALLGVLLLPCVPLAAQLDSTFVETFGNFSRINGGLRYRDNSAVFSVADQEQLYFTNRSLDLRLGGRYKWLGYTFSIPVSDLGTGSDLGDAKSLGVNLQVYRDKVYGNLNVRRTTGFERDMVGEEPVFQKDIRFINALLYGFRILNSNRFSLRSSFRVRNRQLKSAGSLLVGGAVARQVLTADSLRLPLRDVGSTDINRFAQTKVGAGVGYAYTFIFGRFWFVTPLVIAGPELRFIDYDPLGSDREIERVRLSARVRSRLAFGANGHKVYASIIAAYLPSIDESDSFDTRVSETQLELVIGRRLGVDK
ncbi:DUF4421 family protein [Neolewinella sp.]|uniref:DUF4421 family protein n=1 Tax=Neolewinella sp. TaxID=2993543 RepID=UPI003B528D5E